MSRTRALINNVITALVSVSLISISLIATTLVDGRSRRNFDTPLYDKRPPSTDDWASGWALMILCISGLFSIFYIVKAFFKAPDSPDRIYAGPIKRAAGSRLLALAEFLYSRKTVEMVFRPIVADWRGEYYDALQERKRWKARWINSRYRISFLMAMGLSKAFSIVRSLAGK